MPVRLEIYVDGESQTQVFEVPPRVGEEIRFQTNDTFRVKAVRHLQNDQGKFVYQVSVEPVWARHVDDF